MKIQGETITLRTITANGSTRFVEFYLRKTGSGMEKWDAPYFKLTPMEFTEFSQTWEKYFTSDQRCVIEIDGNVIGTVTYY